ncbi:hypothetical protein IIC65_02945, partial [Candidatus Sumerlaeota bacterium]|nr:hypothetical protein [Candidatus Sumerlaeota bacterium]
DLVTFVPDGPGAHTFRSDTDAITLAVLGIGGDGADESSLFSLVGDFIITGADSAFDNYATMELSGSITLGPGSFFHNDYSAVLNVLDGSILDAREAYGYSNSGIISEVGSGAILRNARGLAFTDSSGVPVSSLVPGSPFYVTLVEDDENLDADVAETTEVTVMSVTTLDSVTVLLTEIDTKGARFRNSTSFPTQQSGIANPGDNVLQFTGSEDLLVMYVDSEDGADTITRNLARQPLTWIGEGGDVDWDTPANWSDNRTPTFFDRVLFDSTSSSNCQLSADREVYDFRLAPGYGGTVVAVNLLLLTVHNDVLLEGGTLDWTAGEFDIKGDFVKTGGTSLGAIKFIALTGVTQTLDTGSGGLSLVFLLVNDADDADISGDATLRGNLAIGSSNGGGIESYSLLAIDGTVTLGDQTSFSNFGPLEVLDGAVLDARLAASFNNAGSMNEKGTGKILRGARFVLFTDGAGERVRSVSPGDDVYITLVDDDENLEASLLDVSQATVSSPSTGDSVTIALLETGDATAAFRNSTGLATEAATASPGDQILQMTEGDNLLVTYTDDEDTSDTISQNLLPEPITWDGGGGDFDWSTPENWSGDEVPGPQDSAIFDATSQKACLITQDQQVFDFTIKPDYVNEIRVSDGVTFTVNGDTLIQGGTIRWAFNEGIFRGDVFLEGGTVDWANGAFFFARDFTRTGAASTAVDAFFAFDEPGEQTFSAGADAMTLGSLRIGGTSSENVVNLDGNLTINRQYGGRLEMYSTMNVLGTLTFGVDADFLNFGTINVLDGAVLDARLAFAYANFELVTESGSGKVLRFASDLLFIDSSGAPISSVPIGGAFSVILIDEDENLDAFVPDTTEITLSSAVSQDSETIELIETGNGTGIFVNAAPISAVMASAVADDGVLQLSVNDTVTAAYTDSEDAQDTLQTQVEATGVVVTPTPTPLPSGPAATPEGLSAVAGAASILLAWDPNPEPDLLGYHVYRDTTETGTFDTRLTNSPLASPHYTDADVIAGQNYCYRVSAVRGSGLESAKSPPVCATAGAVVATMSDIRAPAGSIARLRINLSNATGVTGNGLDVTLTYDSSLLTPTEVERSVLLQEFIFTSNLGIAGEVLLSGVAAEGVTITGEGHILDVLFEVSAAATSGQTGLFVFTDVSLFDANASPLAVDFSQAATFTVAGDGILGDIDADGRVTAGDALIALQIATGKRAPTDSELMAGDVNGDGRIDAADVTLILRLRVKLPINPGPQQSQQILSAGTTETFNVTLSGPVDPVELGGVFTLDIDLDNGSKVAGADLVVSFDPVVLKLVDVKKGDLTSGDFNLAINDEGSLVKIALSASKDIDGPGGALAVIRFEVLSGEGAKSPINLGFVKLNGVFGEDLAWESVVTKSGTEVIIKAGSSVLDTWRRYR